MTRRWPRTARGWMTLALWGLYGVMWLGGAGSYAVFGGVRQGDEWAAPLFLALAGILLIASAGARAPALIAAGILGFVAEWVGLTGGWLFGRYEYTAVLSPRLAGVPLVMISAWMVLAAYAHDVVRPWRAARLVKVCAGAGLLTAIDLVIDPLASGPLGYWRWFDGGSFHGVPATNFAGWFLAGAAVLLLLQVLDRGTAPIPAATSVGWSIVLFFTLIAAAYGLVLPTAIGAALCAAHAAVYRRRAGARAVVT